MISTNMYFTHGNSTGELSKKACKILNKWPMQINDKGKTPWEVIKEEWNRSDTRSVYVPNDCIQPDYSIIMPYK